ncbi:hypothetical protein Nepgr_001034 [Nepenthes gracilis]|uniref:Uncharacterized protein n=1 Tax=Nepenthes gracilis TaxID=150966 RepID=A0AAD3RXF7_NEPGR|nr:hypothetical protein Nepgr_001034 [Nepenthes gracilis]
MTAYGMLSMIFAMARGACTPSCKRPRCILLSSPSMLQLQLFLQPLAIVILEVKAMYCRRDQDPLDAVGVIALEGTASVKKGLVVRAGKQADASQVFPIQCEMALPIQSAAVEQVPPVSTIATAAG